jgi:hypothetical protein
MTLTLLGIRAGYGKTYRMRPADKLCFVIGPIGDPGPEVRRHADWLLKGMINPVFEQYFP